MIKALALTCLTASATLGIGGGMAKAEGKPETRFDLILPESTNSAAVTAEVAYGALPRAAALVLRYKETGEIAASVAPFGQGAAAAGEMSQLVVLQTGPALSGTLHLTAWIATDAGERPATADEFRGISVAF